MAHSSVSPNTGAWLERWARFGYAAQGVVYLLVGGLAVAAGFGKRGAATDQHTAFAFILKQPFGHALLAIVATGLAGYAAYRFLAAFTDAEDRGSDAKGLALRAVSFARGAAYFAIAVEVARLAARKGGGSGGNGTARHWAAQAMDAPLGRWILFAVAFGILAAGAFQLYKAAKGKLSSQLRLGAMDGATRERITPICRAGIAARGVVFMIIGLSLAGAAVHRNSSEANGTSGALSELASQPFGHALLVGIGTGLAAFGIYAFVNARYRKLDT